MSPADRLLRVFVNAVSVDVPAGSTALDAVRASSRDEADAIARGDRVITDSRGLPINGEVVAQAGSIFRTVRARESAAPRESAADTDR